MPSLLMTLKVARSCQYSMMPSTHQLSLILPSLCVAREVPDLEVINFFERSDRVGSLCGDDVAACSNDGGDMFSSVFGVHLREGFAFVFPMCFCVLPSLVCFIVEHVSVFPWVEDAGGGLVYFFRFVGHFFASFFLSPCCFDFQNLSEASELEGV